MTEGIIQQLVSERGFGFIRSSDGQKHFFHCRDLARGFFFDSLKEGDAVEFELRPSKVKPGQQEAHQVRLQGVSASAGHKASDSSRSGSAPRGHAAPGSRSGGNTLQVAENLLPYGFVSINPAKAVTDSPVWHDGSGSGELYSGEVRCTLEALTPLLPGNARYKVQELGPAGQKRLQAWDFLQLEPEKQIA
jgi:cold shock CspA family protein